MKNIINQPSIIRSQLADIATIINAEHEAGERASAKGLEHYRKCGEFLWKAKEQCQHGQWLDWLKANVKFKRLQANRYMQLAKCIVDDTFDELSEEWQRIQGNGKPEEEEEATNHKPFVGYNTGQVEWYTPPEYVEAAREVMGGIDLDPASCEVANKTVKAKKYYTKEDDGLTQEWQGKVFLNPPYATGLIDKFTSKLGQHFKNGDVTDAVVIVNNSTETNWFQELANQSSAFCFPLHRIRFVGQDKGSNPLQGQAILYLGNQADNFLATFACFGLVVRGQV